MGLSGVMGETCRVRVLHVLDHSLPIGSGYSYRSRASSRLSGGSGSSRWS